MDEVNKFEEENGVIFSDMPENFLEEASESETIYEWDGGEYHGEEHHA